uniref:Sphingomyelin phosphodiesterase 4 n=1 Tax=Cyprinus carpio carpio TaxID=630221 RepID=A0A8C1FCR2_CYPCA
CLFLFLTVVSLCLQANLKADWTIKPFHQKCHELSKIIDEYPAKELHAMFPWLVESVFGSLDGILGGWNLRYLQARMAEYNIAMDFLDPSGPMMKLVYKLQAEEYKYEFPVSYLPGPIKSSIQAGVLPDCPLFHNKIQFPMSGLLLLSMSRLFTPTFMLCYKLYYITNYNWQHGSCSDSAYFVLVNTYLKYFLPTEGNVPPSPFSDTRGTVASPAPSSSFICFYVLPVSGLPVCLMLDMVFVEMWLHHYSLEMYQKLQSPQVKLALLQYRLSMSSMLCQPPAPPGSGTLHTYQEPFMPSEEHVLVVRLLVKHLHAFSSSQKQEAIFSSPSPHSHSSPLEELKRVVVQRFVQQKLYVFLQHCFGHWPLDASFRAVNVLECTLISVLTSWVFVIYRASFVQENLLMYTKLFQGFLNRAMRTDLVNAKNALMVFRVAKVFVQPNLSEMIQKAEQLFLEPEHAILQRQNRVFLTPSHGGSFLSSRQPIGTDSVFKVKSHVYSLEGQDCQYNLMFGPDLRKNVLKLIQIIGQARQTAKRISDHSTEMAANNSFLSWFSIGSSDQNNTFNGGEMDDMGEGVKKTHEFLDKALDYLCQIFRLNAGQLSQLIVNVAAVDDEGASKQLPDCIPSENGLLLTDLGRLQIINGLRRFEIEYQGDPELQPIRSYESAFLVRLMFQISSFINARFGDHMETLCARQDLLGSIGRHYLRSSSKVAEHRRKSPVTRQMRERPQRARLSLRVLASYRTLLILLLLYMLLALLSFGVLSSTGLILLVSFLYELLLNFVHEKLKTP